MLGISGARVSVGQFYNKVILALDLVKIKTLVVELYPGLVIISYLLSHQC